ncbi:RsmD family RNA methyltransferase, partial [Acidocella sp.]|uniref:RsmD family RNA methyltransferase n=1 Tax=Acidocella sp. TaxID=50710 RepID=UPI00262DA6E7
MSLGPRILAGAWRGRKLVAPEGLETRPTGARARQAVFDILLHAPWAGAEFLRRARVLDVFAGTGAYGLEALSRGAAAADFMEQAPGA